MLIRVLLGLACLAAACWVAATRWSTLGSGHPAYPVLLGVMTMVGIALVVTARRTRPAGTLRTTGRIAAALSLVAVLAAAVWLRPYPADDIAVAATHPSPTVDVLDSVSAWELRPARPSGIGVVFFPGALVDPRAYLPVLRPLAEQGHLVVVLKPPALGGASRVGDRDARRPSRRPKLGRRRPLPGRCGRRVRRQRPSNPWSVPLGVLPGTRPLRGDRGRSVDLGGARRAEHSRGHPGLPLATATFDRVHPDPGGRARLLR